MGKLSLVSCIINSCKNAVECWPPTAPLRLGSPVLRIGKVWHLLVMLALGRRRRKFRVILSYVVSSGQSRVHETLTKSNKTPEHWKKLSRDRGFSVPLSYSPATKNIQVFCLIACKDKVSCILAKPQTCFVTRDEP